MWIALIRLHDTSLHYYTINSEYFIQTIVQYLYENESDVVSLLPIHYTSYFILRQIHISIFLEILITFTYFC